MKTSEQEIMELEKRLNELKERRNTEAVVVADTSEVVEFRENSTGGLYLGSMKFRFTEGISSAALDERTKLLEKIRDYIVERNMAKTKPSAPAPIMQKAGH